MHWQREMAHAKLMPYNAIVWSSYNVIVFGSRFYQVVYLYVCFNICSLKIFGFLSGILDWYYFHFTLFFCGMNEKKMIVTQ